MEPQRRLIVTTRLARQRNFQWQCRRESDAVSILLGSDTKLEADETLTLSMQQCGAASRITITDNATLTIQNDDTAAVTIADVNVAENGAGGTATLTLTLNNGRVALLWMPPPVMGQRFAAGSDYTAISGQTVSFSGTAGETKDGEATFSDDAVAEGDETLTVGMSNLALTSLPVTISDTGTLTINDDDTATHHHR